MSNRIRRHHAMVASLAVTNALGTTAEIDLTEVASGCVLVPSGSPITSLAYFGAMEPGGTYVAIQNGEGQAATQTVAAGNGYPIPDECSSYGALKIVANAAGTVELSCKG